MYDESDFVTGKALAFEIASNNTNHLILKAKEPELGTLNIIGTMLPLSICLN
jgi:hypothetical protein